MASGSTLVLQPAGGDLFANLVNQVNLSAQQEQARSIQSRSQIIQHSTPKVQNNKSKRSQSDFKKPIQPGLSSSGRKNNEKGSRNINNSKSKSNNRLQLKDPDNGWSSGSSGSASPVYSTIQSPATGINRKRERVNQTSIGIGMGTPGSGNRSAACRSLGNISYRQQQNSQQEDAKLAKMLGLSFQQNNCNTNNAKLFDAETNIKNFNKLPSSKQTNSNYNKQQTDDYIRRVNKNEKSSRNDIRNIENWGCQDSGHTASKRDLNRRNDNSNMNQSNNNNHSLYTCHSDSNSSSSTKNNFANNGNNSDNTNNTISSNNNNSNRSNIRVATLHEASHNDITDSFATSLNAYNSNSKNKITSNKKRENQTNGKSQNRQRNRNSNSFSKSFQNKAVIENSRFAGYAASPDPTTLPQPPKNWLTDSINIKLAISESNSEKEVENELATFGNLINGLGLGVSPNGSKTDSYINITQSSGKNNKKPSTAQAISLADKFSNSISLSENDAQINSQTYQQIQQKKTLFANYKLADFDQRSNYSSSS
jgi:hypothetical protein